MIKKNGKPTKPTAAQICKIEEDINLAFSQIPDMIYESENTKEIAEQLDLSQYTLVKECLYKLYYGDKFIVIKGKSFNGSLYLVYKGYVYFVAGGQGTGNRNTIGPGLHGKQAKEHHFSKFYSFIRSNPGQILRIELIMETDDAYKLLTREQQELDAGKGNENFMNSNTTAYVPVPGKEKKKPVPEQKQRWIKKGVIGAFKRYSS